MLQQPVLTATNGDLTSPAWCCTAAVQSWGTDTTSERFESKGRAIINDISFYSTQERDTTSLADFIFVNWVAELVFAGTVRCKGTETLLILMGRLRISIINP